MFLIVGMTIIWGGYNRAVNPDIAIGERIPGVGRNAYVTLSMSW